MLTKDEIIKTLKKLNVETNSILLVHSSLKALGTIEGGAQTVISALKEMVKDGTLVMPTLSYTKWETVFEDWSLDRPSDTGFITETFRLQPNVARSNNETHSVAAFGTFASDITAGKNHTGERYGIFGDYCFSHESAWQRMYDSRSRYSVKAYVLFWGVDMTYNTFKHFAEYRFVEELLNSVTDPKNRAQLKEELSHYPFSSTATPEELTWPFYNSLEYQEVLLKRGIAKKIPLGKGELIITDIFESVNEVEKDLRTNYKEMLFKKACDWVDKVKGN